MKKYKYIKLVLPIVLITFLFGSCISDDLNKNPNVVTGLDPNYQITTVQLFQNNDSETWWRFLIYPGGFVNHWANDWSAMEFGGKGKKANNQSSVFWEQSYPVYITEVVDLVERTRGNDEYTNVHAAARVLKVECFLRLTDYYGDIPYFNAAKAYYTGVFKPDYDEQEKIYEDFFKELKEAAEMFDNSKARLTSDLYYDGNIDKWKRFANSLRLRIAMRLVKVDPAKAKAEAEDAVKSGVFASNEDVCFVKHENILSNEKLAGNGFACRMLPNDKKSEFRITRELVGTMEDTKDPRIRIIAGSYLEDGPRTEITDQLLDHYNSYKKFTLRAQHFNWSDRAHEAIPLDLVINGETTTVPVLLQLMQPSKLISSPASPYIHMSYAEVEFLLAEAAFRGYSVGGTAAAHFEAGIRAAVTQWKSVFGATLSDLEAKTETFVSSNPLRAGQELEQINTQLWVLHFADPIEAWSNWRRTGFPRSEEGYQMYFYNLSAGENQSGGKTPRRMEYPNSEQTKNPEGYQSAIDRMGGVDNWMNRVWWDKE